MNTSSKPASSLRGRRSSLSGILLLLILGLYFGGRPLLQSPNGTANVPQSPNSSGPKAGVAPGEAPESELAKSVAGAERDAAVKKTSEDREQADSPRLGELMDLGNDVKLSTAGLRYTPGSQEGHRLTHVLRHDNDLPSRPGKHGVFDGDSEDLLAVIDEAYLLTKQQSPQVESRREGSRMVHDVDLRRRIGFVGGQDGRRDGNPPVTHVRLVLEGDQVITAFPF